jgi:hypothetical protein
VLQALRATQKTEARAYCKSKPVFSSIAPIARSAQAINTFK